jgi:hypothetical protein
MDRGGVPVNRPELPVTTPSLAYLPPLARLVGESSIAHVRSSCRSRIAVPPSEIAAKANHWMA